MNVSFAAITVASTLIYTAVTAQSLGDVFPDIIDQKKTKLVMFKYGEHRYIYRMFFKVYDIALYTYKDTKIDDILNAQTKYLLEFYYLREIDKTIILKSSEKILKNNLKRDEFEKISSRLNRLNQAYKSVRKGDRSTLSFDPKIGTTLYINNIKIITIEGADFARNYFKIWIGEYPISENMRRDLLFGNDY